MAQRLPPTPVKTSDLYKNEVERLKGRISPVQLLKELNKVWREGIHMYLTNQMHNIELAGSFIWDATPQGGDFWNKLDRGG